MHPVPEIISGARVFDAVLRVYGLTSWTGQGDYANSSRNTLDRKAGEESSYETEF